MSSSKNDPTGSAPARTSAISTVVVEDEASVREILAAWLQDTEGFVCVGTFPDVESAMPKIARCKPDVALVDINLPGLSGIECVRNLKPLLPNTQFVMLTVYQDTRHIFDALTAGATGYLLKRTPREELIAALHEVHAGGSPMSSVIARKVVQSLHQPKAPIKTPDELSKREREILTLLAQGSLYKEIAHTLGIGTGTVNTYIRRIYEKLHVHSRSQAIARQAELKRDQHTGAQSADS